MLGRPHKDSVVAHLKQCSTMAFSPEDDKTYATVDICQGVLESITDPALKARLREWIRIASSNPNKLVSADLGFGVTTENDFRKLNYQFNATYMPEWFAAVMAGDFAEAFKHRSLILGNYALTGTLQKCSAIVRGDPFVGLFVNIDRIMHNIDLNKALLDCVINTSDIFPIHVVHDDISQVWMYEFFDPNVPGTVLLGSLLVRSTDNNQTLFFHVYLYYIPKYGGIIKAVNFRANAVAPGTLTDHVRVFYSELNTLMYATEDMGIKLYYYRSRADKTLTVVSKYTYEEIERQYRARWPDLVPKLADLIPCTLVKNIDKRFEFRPTYSMPMEMEMEQAGGAICKITQDESHITYPLQTNITYHTSLSTNKIVKVFDADIFPVRLFANVVNIEFEYTEKIGDNFFVLSHLARPYSYLTHHTLYTIGKYHGSKLMKYINDYELKHIDKKNVLYEITNRLQQDRAKYITPYPFHSTQKLLLYAYIKEHHLLPLQTNILVFGKNDFFLDVIVYYEKYVNNSFDLKRIQFYLKEYEETISQEVYHYLNNIGIKFHSLKVPLNNEQLNKIKTTECDLLLVDINIRIASHYYLRHYFTFQTWLSYFIAGIRSLRKGGNFMTYVPLATNHLTLNFYLYVAQHFHSCSFISLSWLTFPFMMLIYQKYAGTIDLDYLYDVNKKFYEIDESGGYHFQLTDPDEIKLFVHATKKIAKGAKQYISAIVDIKADDLFYHQYKQYCIGVLTEYLDYLATINNLHLNYNKTIDWINERNLAQSIRFGEKYDIELLPNINLTDQQYFDQVIDTIIIDRPFLYKNRFLVNPRELKLAINDKIDCAYWPQLQHVYYIAENTYKWQERAAFEEYNKIELFINSIQKKLNATLYTDYHVNINEQVVSRAWIKLYEILSEFKFYKYLKGDTIYGFHLCEAPGNFVNSIQYYLQHNSTVKDYEWVAQSLGPELAGFYDSYGFIAKTKDRWDLGIKGTGDITDWDNIKYYYDKYKDADIVIGDCGEEWTAERDPYKNLAVYQLLYLMLLPKVGGCGIIKTLYMNINIQCLSLIYVLLSVYQKVYITKSNMNFWSPETYIVAIGFKGLTVENQNVLWEILDKMVNKRIITYPVNQLRNTFCIYYEHIIQYVIHSFSTAKKFFVWLSKNTRFFTENKETLTTLLKKRNKQWIKRYIKHK